jgi:hypothetical protein
MPFPGDAAHFTDSVHFSDAGSWAMAERVTRTRARHRDRFRAAAPRPRSTDNASSAVRSIEPPACDENRSSRQAASKSSAKIEPGDQSSSNACSYFSFKATFCGSLCNKKLPTASMSISVPMKQRNASSGDADAIAQVQAQVRWRLLRSFVWRGLLPSDDARARAQWEHGGGFSVDASVRIEAADRAARERLLRYCARPPFALERLRQLDASTSATTTRNRAPAAVARRP